MVPKLYNEDHSFLYGELINCLRCEITEERNGTYSLSLTYPITDSLHSYLNYGNLIECKANDEQGNQLFRIFSTERSIAGKVIVTALHISFDLNYDYIKQIELNETTCEEALNFIFTSSEFSSHYVGISDIESKQNYHIYDINATEAIVGEQGSIIDTFGLGAEIKRDNTTIYVLKERGANNGVTIEYGVNMLEENLYVDTTDLITAIYPIVQTTDGEANTIEIRGDKIVSPLADNYCHPYIVFKDYTQLFIDSGSPSKEAIEELARQEFETNKVDIPKCSYTLDFVPLSRCAGYENIQDNIHLCDTVRIIDSRYNINTESKVIKYKYDVLSERYVSMELGQPKSSLHDVIQSQVASSAVGTLVATGGAAEFPDVLPDTPTARVVEGNGTLTIQWSYSNAIFYTYEVYASTMKGFSPSASNLIYSGQSSSYTYNVAPDITWYFRVRVVNTHKNSTDFSAEVSGSGNKIGTGSITIGEDDIKDYMIDTLSLNREWQDTLNNSYIDFTNTYLKDEHSKITLGIDTRNDITLRGKVVQVYEDNQYKDVATKDYLDVALDLKLKDYDTDVSDLDTRVINVENYVNESMANINNTVSGLTNTVNSSSAQVAQNTTDIGVLREAVNKNTAALESIELNNEQIAANTNAIGINSTNIATLNESILLVNETIVALTARILSLETKVAELEGTSGSNEGGSNDEGVEGGESSNEGDIQE